MTISGKKTFLVLVQGESSLTVTVVLMQGKSSLIQRTEEWIYPEQASSPEIRGKGLQQFLKAQRMPLAPVIAALPASRILSVYKQVPPADAATLAALLTLEAERDFAFAPSELILDYIIKEPVQHTGQSGRLLMLAVRKDHAEQLVQMVKAAGLKMVALTSVSLPAMESSANFDSFLGIYAGRQAVEFALYKGGVPVIFKHLFAISPGPEGRSESFGIELIKKVSGEIRKILLLSPSAYDSEKSAEIRLWDDFGFSDEASELLEKTFDLPLKRINNSKDDCINDTDDSVPCSVAAAMANFAACISDMPVNFLRTRLEVRQKSKIRLTLGKAAIVCGAVLLVAAAGFMDLHKKNNEVKNLRSRTNLLSPDLAKASAIIEFTDFLNDWRGDKREFLECIRQITLAFPLREKIWVTSMAIREDMTVIISGKSLDNRTVFDVMDKLKEDFSFEDVNLVYIRKTGGDEQETVYSINLVFKPVTEARPEGIR